MYPYVYATKHTMIFLLVQWSSHQQQHCLPEKKKCISVLDRGIYRIYAKPILFESFFEYKVLVIVSKLKMKIRILLGHITVVYYCTYIESTSLKNQIGNCYWITKMLCLYQIYTHTAHQIKRIQIFELIICAIYSLYYNTQTKSN